MSHRHVIQSIGVDDDLALGPQRQVELHASGRTDMLILVHFDALKQCPGLHSFQNPAFIETDP